jgi:5-formyltetrahydrofolate cyclo-ligase
MNESGHSTKEQLRQQLRKAAAHHDDYERIAQSKALCAQIKTHPLWSPSRSLLFFWPLIGEPDLRPLCHEAIAAGKIVAFPKFLADSACYGAFPVTNLQSDLGAGQFGIPEPTLCDPKDRLIALDLIFVPGIGFSFDGARLGRGKGYYDRLLAEISGTKCGVAFEWQITSDVPTDAHDIRLDCVVTPSQWRGITLQH